MMQEQKERFNTVMVGGGATAPRSDRNREHNGASSHLLRVLCLVSLSMLSLTASAASSMALGYTPKYPEGFTHFDYVNPQAPKGGELTLASAGNFSTLNPFLLKGVVASGVSDLVFETLMQQSADEPYSLYALVADSIELAEDKLSVVFHINPNARFSDGKPITADDVKFSFDTLRGDKAHPFYRFYWGDVGEATVLDKLSIRFKFLKLNPELHLIMAQMPILARHWAGKKAFDEVVTDKPIGSGPYMVDQYDLGKSISFKRNPNYWAKDLNVRRGMFNFERIAYKYYKDETVQLEAFKSGEFDYMLENNSKMWARDYVGPQFDAGKIIKKMLHHSNNAGMQGFVFNLRRDLFKDKRVRKALSLALDFEWANENLFYNQYKRCDSYFSNSELASTGVPEGDELTLLNEFRDRLSPEVFTHPWRPPVNNSPAALRDHLRQAKALLTEAGWQLKEGVLQNAKGGKFEFSVLLMQKGFERILAPYAQNLKKLGVIMNYRTVDVALYQRSVDTFDFDMMVHSFRQAQSPGNELRNLWNSAVADQEGSNNVMGLKDPVVDALIDKVIYASNRKQLVTAARALDRVLLHGEYIVPNWYIDTHRIAYWDKFSNPPTLPLYYQADPWVLQTWWRK